MPICFFRIPAKELLEKGMEGISPRWLLLGEDKVTNETAVVDESKLERISLSGAGGMERGQECCVFSLEHGLSLVLWVAPRSYSVCHV